MSFAILPPEKPSPLASLLTGLGTGLGTGLQEGVQQFKQGQLFEKLGLPKELSGLSPKLQELFLQRKGDIETLKNALKLDTKARESRATYEALSKAGHDLPEYVEGAPSSVWETMAKAETSPAATKEAELTRKLGGHLETIQGLRDLLPYTGATWLPSSSFLGGSLNRVAVQKREEFDNLAFSLEGFLREMSTKGTLPLKTFNELLKKLPNSKLSNRENIGRIDAIEKVVSSQLPKAKTPLKKVSQGTELNSELAKRILEQAGGDKEKARELAKKMGYEF